MRRLFALSLATLLLLSLTASARRPDDFSLNITLTRGERSRDSHSQTTRITLRGSELLYEKTYTGFRGGARSAPVKKSFRLSDEERERLKKLVRDRAFPEAYDFSVAEEESGIRRYFELKLNMTLDGKKSVINVSGPRTSSRFKEQENFQKAYALLDAVYTILSARDKEIAYENRDLISDRMP
jgi:hypothetical protein